MAEAGAALEGLARDLAGAGVAVLVGFPERLPPGAGFGRGVANSAALIEGGRVTHVVRKSLLPTYDVFDEWRYFEPAHEVRLTPFRAAPPRRFRSARTSGTTPTSGPSASTATIRSRSWSRPGPRSSINVSASPFTIEKRHLRPRMLASTARRWRRRWCSSTRWAARTIWSSTAPAWRSTRAGEVVARAAEHEPDLRAGRPRRRPRATRAPFDALGRARSALAALTLGTRDYARRCGFSQARAGAVGRHRLGAGGLHRRARPGPEQRAGGGDALALLVGPGLTPTPPSWRGTWASTSRDPHRARCSRATSRRWAGAGRSRPRSAQAATSDLTEENLQAARRGARC